MYGYFASKVAVLTGMFLRKDLPDSVIPPVLLSMCVLNVFFAFPGLYNIRPRLLGMIYRMAANWYHMICNQLVFLGAIVVYAGDDWLPVFICEG